MPIGENYTISVVFAEGAGAKPNGNLTLIDVFNFLWSVELPMIYSFFVFVSGWAEDWGDPKHFSLQISDPNDDEHGLPNVLWAVSEEITGVLKDHFLYGGFPAVNVKFPRLGGYTVDLLLDGDVVYTGVLEVREPPGRE